MELQWNSLLVTSQEFLNITAEISDNYLHYSDGDKNYKTAERNKERIFRVTRYY